MEDYDLLGVDDDHSDTESVVTSLGKEVMFLGSPILFVCLFLSNITQHVMYRFCPNFYGRVLVL